MKGGSRGSNLTAHVTLEGALDFTQGVEEEAYIGVERELAWNSCC